MEKSILEEIAEFLEYLARADENARKEESLKKKFGEERYKAIYNLIGGTYTGGLTKKEKDNKYFILYIRDGGLKFLEEYNIKKRQEINTRTTLFLTSIIVLTTIANFFKDLNLIDKRVMMLIYAGLAIILITYFKKAKVITI